MNEDEGALTIPPPTRAVAIQEGPGALLTAIVQMARDPSVDADKLEKLLAMQERMEAREAERQFNQAMMRLPPIHVKKNGTIDLTSKEDRAAGRAGKSVPFAKWEDMAAVVEPLLEREGFRLSFDSIPRPGDGGGLIVTGRLSHRDGHGRTASMPLPLDSGPGRNNLQAIGSTLSYGKRYAAEMLLNIVRDGADDDGVRGGQRFIAPDQAQEIAALMKRAGRQEGPFLDRLFGGSLHSIEEIETGAFVVVKNALNMILAQQAKREATNAGV